MTNTNCLEDIRCPKCGQEDRFFIMGCAQFEVTDDGSEAVGDHEWDDQSSTRCPECNHIATLKDFREGPTLPPDPDEMNDNHAPWAGAYFIGASGVRYRYADIARLVREKAPHTLGQHIRVQLAAIGLLEEMEGGVTPCGLPYSFASGAHPIRKQLTSTAMFHTPGLFRALQNDYRIKGKIRQHAVKMLSDGYGLSPDEARGLLSGSIPVEINEAAGTITYEADFRRKPELPPDPDDTNDDRAAWAAAALAKFMEVTGTDDESAVGDLLTDLMHWSDRNNYDFDAALDRARFHYEAETTPESSA
jgi:DNA-directed RNA polymerase subunit RPC12/RpoP